MHPFFTAKLQTFLNYSDCWVTQTSENGGDLGNPFCEVHLYRILRAQVGDFFKSCISYRLGAPRSRRCPPIFAVNGRNRDLLGPMYEVMTVGELTRTATADILHVYGKVNSSATVERVTNFIRI